MRKEKLFRTCLPLLLSASLVLGSFTAVMAEDLTVPDELAEDSFEELPEEELSVEVAETLEMPAYMSLLEAEDLVVITIEEGSASASGQDSSLEKIGDLEETELEALEEYVEGQGFSVTQEAMLAAAAKTEVRTITFTMNGFLSYQAEGYGSIYDAVFNVEPGNYQGNNNAFCIDPSVQAPGSSIQGQKKSYATTVRDYSDPMLVKIMYYGFGGPGDITASYNSAATARHILTHMVATKRTAELGIPGAGNYTYGANDTAKALADRLYNEIKAQPEITGTVSVLTPVSGYQTIMLLAAFIPPEQKGRLTLTKTSANVTLTDGNSNYSLKGAVYGIYSDEALENQVGTFTTNSKGKATETLELKTGTYYVKELTAPKGYLPDETIYTATVKADQTETLSVKDQPAGNPLSLLIEKVDAVTLEATPLLKGAEFTVNFYPVSKKADMIDPERSWIFRTDDTAKIELSDAFKISGDDLYLDSEGRPVLPLGYITIQETKAPAGYATNESLITCRTTCTEGLVSTSHLPIGENAVRENPLTTDLSVRKLVSGSGGNKNSEFHFKLQLTAAERRELPSVIEYSLAEIDGGTASGVLAAEADGSFSFTLQHGQEITFSGLAQGTGYLVNETDGEDQGYTVTADNAEGLLAADPVLVTFHNDKEMIIPTGAHAGKDSLELQLMILVILAGLLTMGWFSRIRKADE